MGWRSGHVSAVIRREEVASYFSLLSDGSLLHGVVVGGVVLLLL